MSEVDCRHFNGYKPCSKNAICAVACPSYAKVGARVLLIHLEALGAVLRSTSLLPAIRRKYPSAHITWVTRAPAHHLLIGLPLLDRVLTTGGEDLLRLSALDFDVALVIDKSLLASGVVKSTRVSEVKGFVTDHRHGAILPASPEARELWEIGLSDQKKFFENIKSEQQLVHESLALGDYPCDEYQTELSAAEVSLASERRARWSDFGRRSVIGFNTGCSPTLPHKKLSVDGHRALIRGLQLDPRFKQSQVVLLGGPEDRERNVAIARGLDVESSPTDFGLRDGLASVEACDLVFSGDSLGMHMAIARRKWVVAWFGPSCAQEIELYGRGRKILTQAPCAPCWKRDCQQSKMCYDQVDFNAVLDALAEGLQWLTLSFKPHSPETSSSPSPC